MLAGLRERGFHLVVTEVRLVEVAVRAAFRLQNVSQLHITVHRTAGKLVSLDQTALVLIVAIAVLERSGVGIVELSERGVLGGFESLVDAWQELVPLGPVGLRKGQLLGV